MMEEAREKYTRAMSAASAEMILGIASVAAGAASAISSGVAPAAATNPLVADLHFHADDLQKRVSASEREHDAHGDGGSEAARDRKRSSQDNVQKFLDLLRSVNPQI